MNLLNLYRLLLRRKFVVVPMLVLSVAAIGYAYTSAPPIYRSSGALALANPAIPDTAEGIAAPEGSDNPYYRYGDLSVIVQILTRQVSSPAVGDELQAKGLTGTYMVSESLAASSGPIIEVSTEAPSAQEAMTSAELVMDEVNHQLEVLQDRENTAKQYQIFAIEISSPQPGTKVVSGTLRKVMMVAVLAGVATLGVAVLADLLASSRAKRKLASSGTSATTGAGTGQADHASESAPNPDRSEIPSDVEVAVPAGTPTDDVTEEPWWPDAARRGGASSTVRRGRTRRPTPAARRVPRR